MKLSSLFSDGAVLQRGMPIPVWGTAQPNALISIRIGNSSAMGFSSTDGDFLIRVPEIPAGGPYTILAEDLANGEKIEVKDVLVGEVWLASGQSNMEFRMPSSPQIEDFIKLNKDPSMLRTFRVNRRASLTQEKTPVGKWSISSKENLAEFSAVAGWFGKVLKENLNIPVGIVFSSWGGTFIEAWTSRNTLIRNPELRDEILSLEQELAGAGIWKTTSPFYPGDETLAQKLKKMGVEDTGNEGLGKGWAERDFDDSDWKDYQVPGDWIKQRIAGNGLVWARLSVNIPERWNGRPLTLSFGGIDKQDITWFNGVEIGRTGKDYEEKFWDQPRKYTVPGNLVKPGKAVIAVRMFSFVFDGGFNGAEELYSLAPADEPSDTIPLNGIWKAAVERDFKGVCPLSAKGPNNPNTYSILFDAMIRPLIPYAIRGAIWYQGETNAHSIGESRAYERLMRDMICDWRFLWGQGDFPFFMVQLANFRTPAFYDENSAWAPLRESQRRVSRDIPFTDMAVASDCGEEKDIHPKDKRTVGERLAALALRDVYGKDIPAQGPLPAGIRKENGGLRILFSHADGGLVFRSESRLAFRIAGTDGVYQEVETLEIQDSSIFVRSSAVPFPVSVRYNWSDNPQGALCNGAGFPASPFEEK